MAASSATERMNVKFALFEKKAIRNLFVKYLPVTKKAWLRVFLVD